TRPILSVSSAVSACSLMTRLASSVLLVAMSAFPRLGYGDAIALGPGLESRRALLERQALRGVFLRQRAGEQEVLKLRLPALLRVHLPENPVPVGHVPVPDHIPEGFDPRVGPPDGKLSRGHGAYF